MKNKIKIVLLTLIALGFGYKTYTMLSDDGSILKKSDSNTNAVVTADETIKTSDITPIKVQTNDKKNEIKTNPNEKKTSIVFEETEFDFGDVIKGENVQTSFKFVNTGENPLIIKNAKGSCGCTVPQYPREPIGPGESAEILIEFNSAKGGTGNQNKTITVTANTDPDQFVLRIRANVIVDEEE